jgi:hypothetical protein
MAHRTGLKQIVDAIQGSVPREESRDEDFFSETFEFVWKGLEKKLEVFDDWKHISVDPIDRLQSLHRTVAKALKNPSLESKKEIERGFRDLADSYPWKRYPELEPPPPLPEGAGDHDTPKDDSKPSS